MQPITFSPFDRYPFLLLYKAITLAWLSISPTYLKAQSPKPLNVLLIIVDDLKPALGCYGDPIARTPHIDKLARNGILFRNAHAQIAMCGPSRTSFLTSRLPDTTRVYDLKGSWRRLGGNITTMPQYFKEQGYHTHSIGKVFHPNVVPDFRDDYPLSWSQVPYHSAVEKYMYSKTCPNPDGSYSLNAICPVNLRHQPGTTLVDIESLTSAKEFLTQYANSRDDKLYSDTEDGNYKKPYFLALGFNKPHIPFKYPEQYKDLYPLENMIVELEGDRPLSHPAIAWDPYLTLTSMADMEKINISYPFTKFNNHTERLLKQSYYASISYIDGLVGQLIDHLAKLPMMADTIIALISDHSFMLGENQAWAKFSNYQATTHVPFIIRTPKNFNEALSQKSQTGIIYDRVELLDLFPTLVDLAFAATSTNSIQSISSSLLPKCNSSFDKPYTQTLCSEGKSLSGHFVKMTLKAEDCLEKICRREIGGSDTPLTLQSPELFGMIEKTDNYSRWQYPRATFYPTIAANYINMSSLIRFMGYSLYIYTYRYTEWVSFRHSSGRGADWSKIYVRELYDTAQDPGERCNLIFKYGRCNSSIDTASGSTESLELKKAYERYHVGLGNSSNRSFIQYLDEFYKSVLSRIGIQKVRLRAPSQTSRYGKNLNDESDVSDLVEEKNILGMDIGPKQNTSDIWGIKEDGGMLEQEWLGIDHNGGNYYIHSDVDAYERSHKTVTCTDLYGLENNKSLSNLVRVLSKKLRHVHGYI